MRILLTGGSGFIGRNLIELLNKDWPQNDIYNIDINPIPQSFDCKWINCDIMDKKKLFYYLNQIDPHYVIHLAAETNCDSHFTIDDYNINIQGAKNIFEATNKINSILGLIHISTQFVNQTDFPLNNFYKYRPHTVYGKSKVLSEKLLINGGYKYDWVILRPTNIWGKWHPRYPTEFWKVLNERKYIHPSKHGVIRSYGYVGNLCQQIFFFMDNIREINISKKIYYVGDKPIELYDWVNSFSLAITGQNVRKVPQIIILSLAYFGTFLEKLKIQFPITISRYINMVKSNPAPMKKTLKLVEKPKYSLDQGIKITVDWLKEEVFD